MISLSVGDAFGRLTVVGEAPVFRKDGRGANRPYYECRCECGAVKLVQSSNLRSGNTISCGCYRRQDSSERLRKQATKHGMTRTPIYNLWQNMLHRCYCERSEHYYLYGARGITVAPEWHEFEAFYRDMGERPPGKTLDRINNALGYSKDNCRWATPMQQGRNKRNNKWVEYDGKRLLLVELAERLNLSVDKIRVAFRRPSEADAGKPSDSEKKRSKSFLKSLEAKGLRVSPNSDDTTDFDIRTGKRFDDDVSPPSADAAGRVDETEEHRLMKHAGTWQGDDFEDCLAAAKASEPRSACCGAPVTQGSTVHMRGDEFIGRTLWLRCSACQGKCEIATPEPSE